MVALFLAELSELEDGLVGIALAALGGATVPHNGLDDVAGAAVVEAFRSRTAFTGQSAAPEGSGAAPTRADIVLHKQSVLHHVRVGPNLLIGIARHVGVGEEAVGVLDIVAARGPRGTMASGATHFGKQPFAFLELVGRGIASGRNGQTAVPNHQVLVLLGRHLGFERLARQVRMDVALEIARVPLRMLPFG